MCPQSEYTLVRLRASDIPESKDDLLTIPPSSTSEVMKQYYNQLTKETRLEDIESGAYDYAVGAHMGAIKVLEAHLIQMVRREGQEGGGVFFNDDEAFPLRRGRQFSVTL